MGEGGLGSSFGRIRAHIIWQTKNDSYLWALGRLGVSDTEVVELKFLIRTSVS